MRSLDILRGFALFGMILVHVHQHLEQPATGLEDAISWGIWVGAEQKSWATFAFLFGVGFALQLRHMEAKGAPVTSLYLRRLFGLALFGIPAYLLFGFRILLDYAFWGVPLLFLRRWSTRSLLVAALVSIGGVFAHRDRDRRRRVAHPGPAGSRCGSRGASSESRSRLGRAESR